MQLGGHVGRVAVPDVEAMKAATRRYVKRQLTWLRKLPEVQTIDVTGRAPQDTASEVLCMWRSS